jgi:predicted ATP-binding protein involved in virulence
MAGSHKSMAKKKRARSYFTYLELENVRCFNNVRLDLTHENGDLAQWTLLLGDNGVGKTTLLQCLGWMRPELVEESVIPESVAHFFKEGKLGPALTYEENVVFDDLLSVGNESSLKIVAEMCQGSDLKFNSKPTGKKITTQVTCEFNQKDKELRELSYKPITNIKQSMKAGFWEPLIVAYGANRWMGIQNTTKVELEDPIANHLSVLTELWDVGERLVILEHAASDKELKRLRASKVRPRSTLRRSKEERLFEAFKSVLAKVFPDEIVSQGFKIEVVAPQYKKGKIDEGSVRFNINGKLVPFSSLSLGYQTTSAWVLDLAWRLFERYPESANPIAEPAIVLIDELDLHLHPKWQMQIMWKLAKTFAGTQFIATSHSPLMVQTMPNANFAVIERDQENEFFVENEPAKVQGWRIDQILNSQYFDTSLVEKNDSKKLFEERNKLLLKKNRSRKEQRRLSQLEEKILSVATGVVWDDNEAFDLLKKSLYKNSNIHTLITK